MTDGPTHAVDRTDWIRVDDAVREDAERERVREHRLRWQAQENDHGRTLVRVWAPVVAVVAALCLALSGYAVYWHSHNEALEQQPDRKVDVWCYDDPQSTAATRHYYGARDLVQLACRDGAPARSVYP